MSDENVVHVPVAQWLSTASAAQKVVGSIPREHILMKMYNLNVIVSRFG